MNDQIVEIKPIEIRVLFFGAVADAAGRRELNIASAEISTLGSLQRFLAGSFPELSSKSLLFSVNQQHAPADQAICGGDEIGVFTAVSGG